MTASDNFLSLCLNNSEAGQYRSDNNIKYEHSSVFPRAMHLLRQQESHEHQVLSQVLQLLE